MDSGSADPTRLDHERAEAVRLESRAIRQISAEARARAQAARDRARRARSRREILRDSAFARLQARLGTMPVIEQAKGIIMDQQRCGPNEAFDLLRLASQHANVKLHVLAAQVVQEIAAGSDGGNVTPIFVGARGDRRARTQPAATR